MSILITIIILFICQSGISYVLSMLLGFENYRLISTIVSVVVSFVYPFIAARGERKLNVLKNPGYHATACILCAAILILNMLLWMLGIL